MAVRENNPATTAGLRARDLLGALAVLLLVSSCAAGSSEPATGSGGADAAAMDGGTKDGSSTDVFSGSGGSQGSGGSSSSGGVTGSGSGGSSATGGAQGSGGAAAGTGGSSGAGGASAPRCSLSIEPVSPPTFTGIDAGPNAKLRVHGVATHSTVAALTWTWTVTASGGMDIETTNIDKARSTIEFRILSADTFRIVASVDDPSCGSVTKTATAVVSKPGFLFRTTASNFPVQEQRIDQAAGSSVRIDLQSGRQYMIRPLQAEQLSNLVSGYLRLTDPGANFSLEANTTHGPLTATLISGAFYNLLVVPDDNTVAPLLVRNRPDDLQGFPVDRGLHVLGRALDANGDPVVGARMILKNGDLPSTVGLSNASGQMELWARAGAVAAIVVPPAGLGLPQARVDLASDGSGIVVPNSSSLTLTMTWAAVARGPLTISVLGVDGTSAVSGARVRVSLRPSTTPVGVITASGGGGSDLGFSAMGSNNAELTSDSKGQARFAMLPVGTYDVTVTPPTGLALAATTGLSVTLPAAGLSRSVTLAQKVNLTGTTSPGASVTAIDTSPDASGTTVTAIAGSNGAFTLVVDPGRTYELILQPQPHPGQALGRRVIREASVAASGSSLGSIPLPPAVTVTGNVMNAGKPVVDAFVQVFCVATSATCVDPAISLGDVTTLPDGSFTLSLPDLAAPM